MLKGKQIRLTPPKGIRVTNEHLKTVAQVISSAYDEKCKENFGKPFSEIHVLIPEEWLAKKFSPVEKKKLKRYQQRQTKAEIIVSTVEETLLTTMRMMHKNT